MHPVALITAQPELQKLVAPTSLQPWPPKVPWQAFTVIKLPLHPHLTVLCTRSALAQFCAQAPVAPSKRRTSIILIGYSFHRKTRRAGEAPAKKMKYFSILENPEILRQDCEEVLIAASPGGPALLGEDGFSEFPLCCLRASGKLTGSSPQCYKGWFY